MRLNWSWDIYRSPVIRVLQRITHHKRLSDNSIAGRLDTRRRFCGQRPSWWHPLNSLGVGGLLEITPSSPCNLYYDRSLRNGILPVFKLPISQQQREIDRFIRRLRFPQIQDGRLNASSERSDSEPDLEHGDGKPPEDPPEDVELQFSDSEDGN